jgi:hypothetical protein
VRPVAAAGFLKFPLPFLRDGVICIAITVELIVPFARSVMDETGDIALRAKAEDDAVLAVGATGLSGADFARVRSVDRFQLGFAAGVGHDEAPQLPLPSTGTGCRTNLFTFSSLLAGKHGPAPNATGPAHFFPSLIVWH